MVNKIYDESQNKAANNFAKLYSGCNEEIQCCQMHFEKIRTLFLKKKIRTPNNNPHKENFQFLPLKGLMHMFFNKIEPISDLNNLLNFTIAALQ